MVIIVIPIIIILNLVKIIKSSYYLRIVSTDAIALYVESLASQSYETQSVPANIAAAGQQLPYQPIVQPGVSVPGASPQAAVPAPQPQMHDSQKVSTHENTNVRAEGKCSILRRDIINMWLLLRTCAPSLSVPSLLSLQSNCSR